MYIVATVLAWIVSFVVASAALGAFLSETSSGVRTALGFVVGGVVAAATYTALREGPGSLIGLLRRR